MVLDMVIGHKSLISYEYVKASSPNLIMNGQVIAFQTVLLTGLP